MTIKQLANELDVSKQTISNVIAQLGLQGKVRRVGNRYMLSEIQVAQVKLKISEDTPEKIQSSSEKSGKSPNEVLQCQLSMVDKQLAIKDSQIQMLQEQLATKDSQIRLLQEQLIAKDSQIGQITAAMESMATAFTATQALHAVTIQKQLSEHSAMDQLSDVEQPKQKQGLFSRLFGRKEN